MAEGTTEMLKTSKLLTASDMFTAINGKQYRIDLLGAGYKCDAMKVYGEKTRKTCENAINRKLKKQEAKTGSVEDPEITIPGFGIMRLSQIKVKAKSYMTEMLARAEKEDWDNVPYFAYQNGVLKALVEAIVKHQRTSAT